MEVSVNSTGVARKEIRSESIAIPWFVYAALFGSVSIVIGGYWDISWHQTIGRDTFWSPPHMAIYLGGVAAGISSGLIVLKTTLTGSNVARAESVRLWGFTGPLGAFFCLWGAIAMLTSAPFDDWWHNAYGLDTEILSPPHVVLALGIGAIQLGAMIEVLALQNRSEHELNPADPLALKRRAGLRLLYICAAGLLLANVSVMAWSYMFRTLMHSSIFYQVGCAVLPLFLIAAARASNLRWPATATAAVYTVLWLALLWILPLFPAEPKLGPIRQHVTHMVPLEFPILLIVPAFGIDILMRRLGRGRDWLLAVLLGITFFVMFLAAQWPFGTFLMSPDARNWIFATHKLAYYIDPNWSVSQFQFYEWDTSSSALIIGLACAIPLAIISARIGLWWGNWMRKVQR